MTELNKRWKKTGKARIGNLSIFLLALLCFVPWSGIADESNDFQAYEYLKYNDYQSSEFSIDGTEKQQEKGTYCSKNGFLAYQTDFDFSKAVTSGDYTYLILSDGTIALININEDHQTETLDIPETIDGYTVSHLGVDINVAVHTPSSNHFIIADRVKKINFPVTLRVIGADAINANQLKEIVYPEGVTDIGTILFSENWYAGKITLPSTLKRLGTFAFANTEIKAIDLPNGLEEIGMAAFMKDDMLTMIKIPGSVTTVGLYAFCGCTSLKSVTIEEGVGKISTGMFCECKKLGKIALPASITEINEKAFENCTKLSKVTFTGDGIKTIGEAAFRYCSSLSKIAIPNGIEEIGDDAFYGCEKLTSVTLPASIARIGDSAFTGCSQKITFTVTDGSYALQWANDNGYQVKTIAVQ